MYIDVYVRQYSNDFQESIKPFLIIKHWVYTSIVKGSLFVLQSHFAPDMSSKFKPTTSLQHF